GAQILAPVEVEAVDRVPVALAKRIGEAAIDRPAGIEPDQISCFSCSNDLTHGVLRRCQRAAALVGGRLRLFVDQQPGIFGQLRQNLPQCAERLFCNLKGVNSERNRCRRLPPLPHETQRQAALLHASRLAHLALVEANEVGALAAEVAKQSLARTNLARELVAELEELLFHGRLSR